MRSSLMRIPRRLGIFVMVDDAFENHHRAPTYKFELFELILLSKSDTYFLVEQIEAIGSQKTATSPNLHMGKVKKGSMGTTKLFFRHLLADR